ncbi:adenine-specific DNA-methyltransferase [Streptococcus henryi]|uniref:Adenine-specific DNA-methyltransferase n=1 Tax=Streptococcus henryi TaxID=439219 RepID=A0A1G6B699_9STRE|nr:site-specific DNA-methyltransferase [Streptococcus henryi]SDB15943.1 adenine-specific DNA-methyltransferase [Streptococcus henryi]
MAQYGEYTGVEMLDSTSMNITQDNISKIGKLFPQVLTESQDDNGRLHTAIDFDKLKDILSHELADGPETYEFTWVGKRDAMAEAGRPTSKTLRPDLEESVDFDKTENVFITGDNLEVLKILQESYLNKIDMIYIDPPYNTGKDFVYSDKFQMTQEEIDEATNSLDETGKRLVKNEKSNARYHSDWLNMMYPRLVLARNLLKDSGVIFISIDDNEQANLKAMCDEIFGEENFVVNLAIENNPKGRKNSKFVSVNHESLLIYAKNIEITYPFKSVVKKDDLLKDEFGYYSHGKRVLVGESTNDKANGGDKDYSVYYDGNSIILKKEKIDEYDKKLIFDGYKIFKSIKDGVLLENTYTKNKFYELFESNSLLFKENSIYEKDRNVYKQQKSLIKSTDEWDLKTETAAFIESDFDSKKLFSMPKNPNYIKMLLFMLGLKNAMILDFFAGSATTADAVMQLNAEDGGHRKYILATLDEPVADKSAAKEAGYETIDQISRERIRRAAEKIKSENPDKVGGQDFGFKAFKVDSSNFRDVYSTPDSYSQQDLFESVSNIKENRTDLDLLFQVMLRWGMELSLNIAKEEINGVTVYNVDDNSLLACFANNISEETVKAIASKEPLRAIFKDESFANSSSKINLTQIFKEISPMTKVKVV